jgi:tetrahydromethanopterin S-methyltransferase subunit G
MRKVLISLAAAGAALVFATPAAAQYYPQQQPYGYGYNGYGNNNFGQVRALQERIDGVERQIRFLDRRNVVRDDRADRLRGEANDIERRLHRAERHGLNPYEANEINARIARLEQRVQFAASNRYGRYGNGYYGDGDRDHDRD